jgi:hypothetical protein
VKGEIFSVGALAPKARFQDLQGLTEAIVHWFKKEPGWLKAA